MYEYAYQLLSMTETQKKTRPNRSGFSFFYIKLSRLGCDFAEKRLPFVENAIA